MYTRSEDEAEVVASLTADWFPAGQEHSQPTGSEATVRAIVQYVDGRFSAMKYILGLAIDFVVLAQRVSQADANFTPLMVSENDDTLFGRYPLVQARGTKKSNTLTVTVGEYRYGIRKTEERVADAFHKMQRSDFPSAYVYNTGQWSKFRDLLALAFGLDEIGRRRAVEALFDYGLEHLEKNTFYFQPLPRPRVFQSIIQAYPRSDASENGGLAFQALIYGWCCSFYTSLQIDADKVRTGSKRQRRFGDMDGYLGLTLELSIEVKDMLIDGDNYERQIRQFAELVANHEIHAVVAAAEFDDAGIAAAKTDGLIPLDLGSLGWICALWDWRTQDEAVQHMLHYLAHIEQNPKAVKRLLSFIQKVDPDHATLAYADDD